MADALWPFENQFRVWHTSPPNGPLSFFRLSNEFHDAGCPLRFQGTAKNLWQLFDPTSKPPYSVAQYPHLSLTDFVCWLQLPSDVVGTDWYFGYVYFDQSRQRKKLFDEFRELAAQAGACLRTNPRFREWLWPCLQYLSQADRYPQLRDGEDIAWWVALLFTKPDLCQLIHSACSRNDIADVVQFEIENAALVSKEAIRSRQLFGDPLWPTVNCRVARPFREIPCPDFVDAPAIPDEHQENLGATKSAIQSLKQTALPEPNGAGVPCLVVILERLGWRVFKNRRRRKRLEVHFEEAKTKNQPTTTLETQSAELKVELARYVDLLNDCAEWVRVRTGIPKEKLVEVATSTAFTEGKDRDDIYAKLGTLDERGLTAELWKRLLSEDRDALVSVGLLPSPESSPLASKAVGHCDYVADETSSSPAPRAEAAETVVDDSGKQPASNANERPPDGGALYKAAQVAMQGTQNDPYSSEWRLPDDLLSDPQLRIELYTRFENDLTAWLNGNHNPSVWDEDDWKQWADDAAMLTTLAEMNGLESWQLSELHYSAAYPGRDLSDDVIVGARTVVGALKAKARAELAQPQTATHSPAAPTADRSAVVAGKTPDGESSTPATKSESDEQGGASHRDRRPERRSVEREPAFERFSNFSYFTDIAQELLHWSGGLPLPRNDGFEGNPYFSESDITELLTEVRRYCPDFSSQQWLANPDPSALLIEMELALELRKKAEASEPDSTVTDEAKSPPPPPPVEARFSWKVDGENFVIRFDGESGSFLKKWVGFQRYRRLLQSRDGRVSMGELYAGQTDQRVTNDLEQSTDWSANENDLRAIDQKRQELVAEQDEARTSGDTDKVAECEEQIKKVDDWLKKNTRFKKQTDGTSRRVAKKISDPYAKMRSAIWDSFTEARERMIAGNMPKLAQHLEPGIIGSEGGEFTYSLSAAVAWVFE